MEQSNKDRSKWMMALAGSQLGFVVVAGLLGGIYLDRYFKTSPWIGFAGLVGGFTVGIKLLIRIIKTGSNPR